MSHDPTPTMGEWLYGRARVRAQGAQRSPLSDLRLVAVQTGRPELVELVDRCARSEQELEHFRRESRKLRRAVALWSDETDMRPCTDCGAPVDPDDDTDEVADPYCAACGRSA